MKILNFYQRVYGTNDSKCIFDIFLRNLKPSISRWDYFIDWDKVLGKIEDVKIALNILNYLIGESDFDGKFKLLLKQYPESAKAIPILIACRTNIFDIFINYGDPEFTFERYDFSKTPITEADINKYLYFIEQTGIKDLVTSGQVKNFTDYVAGVEVGLNTHARKNRGGKLMEEIVEVFIKDICKKKQFAIRTQAKTDTLLQEWGCEGPKDKSSRIYDFAVKSQTKLFLVETDFYNTGGSKPNSRAEEYRLLNNTLSEGGYSLIWITDGAGWKTSHKKLNDAFDNNDYIFNLSMLENGILDEVLS